MTVQERPRESLAQAAGAVFRHQLVAFLVIWLAIGFPVTCQVHGMMSMYELEPHQHMGDQTSEYPCAIHAHNTAPSMTMLLSLITSWIPDQITCRSVISSESLPATAMRWPLQLTLRLL